jgi:hypothetical protein
MFTRIASAAAVLMSLTAVAALADEPVPVHHETWGAVGPALETDLAVTDIFLDRRQDGQLWVRITNHGPHPVGGRPAELIVVVDGHGLLAGCGLNVVPGQTQTLNTGMIVDASQRMRDITVTVRVPGMRDLRPWNNTYRERVP